MTVDCAKCGSYLADASRLDGKMEKLCPACQHLNRITGTAQGTKLTVTVEATPAPEGLGFDQE